MAGTIFMYYHLDSMSYLRDYVAIITVYLLRCNKDSFAE